MELEYCLLVFDNSCREIFNDKEFSKLATEWRHKNISENLSKTEFYFNKVNGHKLLILIQHISFYLNHPVTFNRLV